MKNIGIGPKKPWSSSNQNTGYLYQSVLQLVKFFHFRKRLHTSSRRH